MTARIEYRENPLAGFWFSRYSVQDSIMLPVGKLGFGAGMYGGICAASRQVKDLFGQDKLCNRSLPVRL